MPTSLEDQRTPGAPVVKRKRLGEVFIGALVRTDQRDVQKDGAPVLKADGKARQELVLTLVVMPGTTATAGIGDQVGVPEPGETVRLILRGAGFSQWIEAKRALDGGLMTGDVVTQTTEFGQAYNGANSPVGPKLTTQAELDAVDRNLSLGVYGSLTLRRPTADEARWATMADEAYHASKRAPVSLEAQDDEEPF